MAEENLVLEELRALRTELESFRTETRTSFRSIKSQLHTLEFGVLTIAQKLLWTRPAAPR